jgi:hypothetical protein
MMTPVDIIVYVSGLCALIMVAGAIWLLGTGVIKLSEAAKDGVTVEVAHQLRISSRNPAIALFVIGLCFVALAAYYASKPRAAVPLYIVGKLKIDDAKSVSMTIVPDNVVALLHPDGDGTIDQKFDVDFHTVKVEINAAGYVPASFPLTLRLDSAKSGTITLPDNLVFTKDTSQVAPSTGTIAPLPAGVDAPLAGTNRF